MKEKLEELISQGYSNIKIGELLNIHRTTVPKWIKKYGIDDLRNGHCGDKIFNDKCKLCGKDINYNPSNRSCCPTCVTRIRRYRLKKKAVEYKGNKCEICGFDESLAAMEFHHSSENKDFEISDMNHKSWDFIKPELDKCVLICSNCHRQIHSKYDDLGFLDFIQQYSKKDI